jgi:hypothetical protein
MLVRSRLVQVVQESGEASLRDHISLKMRGENRRRKTTQPPTLSNALNVLSLNGSGKHALNASRALTERESSEYIVNHQAHIFRNRSPGIIAQSQVAPHDVFEQPDGLSFHQLVHHIAQHGPHGIEPLIRMADIRQTRLVQQDLLNDEDRNGLRKLRTGLHDPQAKWDYLCREEEVNHGRVVVLL